MNDRLQKIEGRESNLDQKVNAMESTKRRKTKAQRQSRSHADRSAMKRSMYEIGRYFRSMDSRITSLEKLVTSQKDQESSSSWENVLRPRNLSAVNVGEVQEHGDVIMLRELDEGMSHRGKIFKMSYMMY